MKISRAESVVICIGAVLDVLQRRHDERGDVSPELAEAVTRYLLTATEALRDGQYLKAERQHRIALALVLRASDATKPKIA